MWRVHLSKKKSSKFDIFLDSGVLFETVISSDKISLKSLKYNLVEEGFPENIVVQRRRNEVSET